MPEPTREHSIYNTGKCHSGKFDIGFADADMPGVAGKPAMGSWETGMQVLNTDDEGPHVWSGSAWFRPAAAGWIDAGYS